MNNHPAETDLALLAGGDCSRVSRFFLQRHLRDCRECTAKVARFEILRSDVARLPEPELDWNRVAAEMKANIRLGLEAGACVGELERRRQWSPRLAVAFASVAFLAFAGFMMKSTLPPQSGLMTQASPVLESTGAGLELRDGANSMMLLNRSGAVADQTVSAEGAIGARRVENGTVTITNVSF